NVFLYAYKYENRNALLLVRDSSNVGVFGGSGNYSLYAPDESCIVCIVRSSSYVFANLARRPDPANTRDRPNASLFDVIADGANHVPANPNNLTLFKSGEVTIAPFAAVR